MAIRAGHHTWTPEPYLDLVRLLLRADDDYDLVEEYLQRRNGGFLGSSVFFTPSVLSCLLQRPSIRIQDLSLEQCLQLTETICLQQGQRYVATLARMLLEGRNIDSTLCNIESITESGRLLIHCLAQQLGYMFGDLSIGNCDQVLAAHWDPSKWPTKADNWQSFSPLQNLLGFTCEVLAAGPRLNSLVWEFEWGGQLTPLLIIFFAFFQDSFHLRQRIRLSILTEALVPIKMWLRLLQTSGIDLEEYGRKESGSCYFVGTQEEVVVSNIAI
jgi:hypothetical protein